MDLVFDFDTVNSLLKPSGGDRRLNFDGRQLLRDLVRRHIYQSSEDLKNAKMNCLKIEY